jgi:two-component system NtrC family sensor kinase
MSNSYASLPLQKKVALTLLLTISAFAAISYLILSEVVAPAFEDLELEAARSDLVRAEQAIQNDIRNLEAITADWAPWDDIYEYVLGRNPAFRKSNLDRPTLENLNLDMMAIYANGRRFVWGQLLLNGEEIDLAELGILSPGDTAFADLAGHDKPEDRTIGIVATQHGPMIISSRPILMSDDSGPVAGAVVMAQFLDSERLALLQERTEVNVGWTPYVEFEQQPMLDVAEFNEDDTHVHVHDSSIVNEIILKDIFGAPALVLRTATSRNISALGYQTMQAAMMFLLLAGLVLTVVMWYLLRSTILAPIELLAGHMAKIRKSGDLSQQLEISGDDEVGLLATQFNRLTSEVHEARKALLFQSFKAGKADTAVEVLHNIRNAMTPLLNGVERIAKAFRVTDNLRVHDATAQLRAADCPPERAEKLLEYVEASFEHVKNSNSEATDDMRIVMSQARQVEDILADQEKFAIDSPATENISVDEVVGEAAHVIPKDAKKKIRVELDDELQGLRVHAHRIGLLQVMGNLILNAYESIQRASQKKGQIFLTAKRELVEDQVMVRLTVGDNGTGFEGDAETKVFQRGFTSKSEGDTTGLGLHWCANAVAGMGGRISAESDGAGKGARFHVLLPIAQGV